VAAVTDPNCWRTGQREVQADGIGISAADTSGTVSSYFNECGQRHTECEKSKGEYEFLKKHDFGRRAREERLGLADRLYTVFWVIFRSFVHDRGVI
jgi:hypothetical protein